MSLGSCRPGSCFSHWCLALLLCGSAVAGATAQTVTGTDLKAAFLFNFLKFVDWPPESLADGNDLVLCVSGDTAVAQSLDRVTKGHAINGHQIVVSRTPANSPVGSCHMIYAAGADTAHALTLIESLSGKPVFTVSDLPAFTAMGGTAHLFVESGHMRFAVNVEAAQRAKLRLSSRLLALAKLVKDDPNVSSR